MRKENEYFLRFVLLLIKGGGCVLRKIVKNNIKKKNPDIRSFLTKNKDAICHLVNQQQQDLLYSQNDKGHDLETWDISLLVCIALNFFKDDIGSWKSETIEHIQVLRNEFSHKSSPDIDTVTFESKRREFIVIIQILSADMTEKDKAELNDLEDNINDDKLDNAVNDIQSMDKEFYDDTEPCLCQLLQLQAQSAEDIEKEIETVQQENEKLIEEILNYCDNPDQKNPHVIMLLGCPGAGKSSLINTLHKALTGNYYCIARPGGGGAKTITAEVTKYDNCGVKLYNIKDVGRKERITPLLKKLPHFLDLAGFMDEEEKYQTLLGLLIGGYIPPGASIQALQDMNDAKLRILYDTPHEEWKVTKICFVQCIQQGIPYNLIKCLQSTLKICDEFGFRKSTAEVFLILSRWDVVHYPDKRNKFALPGKTYVSLEEAMKNQQELLSLFNLKGVDEIYSRQWASFTSNTSFDNVFIENNALKCLKLLVQPGKAKAPTPYQPVDDYKRFRLYMHELWQIVKMYKLGIIVAFPIIILAVLIMLLTKTFY